MPTPVSVDHQKRRNLIEAQMIYKLSFYNTATGSNAAAVFKDLAEYFKALEKEEYKRQRFLKSIQE